MAKAKKKKRVVVTLDADQEKALEAWRVRSFSSTLGGAIRTAALMTAQTYKEGTR